MKRLAYARWSSLPTLSLLVLPLIPFPAGGQTKEVVERQQEALRRIEEHLAQVHEEEAARALLLAEMSEAQRAEMLAQTQEREAALRSRVERLRQEQRLRSERMVQHNRLRSEEIRQRAEELAVRLRERSEADRTRAEERFREAQQVMVRVRARARLGVSLDGRQGEEYDRQGARITDVVEESPADEAGLREGDIITHLDGQSLLNPIPGEDEMEFGEETSLPVQRLMALARDLEDGQEVEVRYLRDGQAATVTLEAAELDDRWVTVLPGGSEERVFRMTPEGRLRWRYAVPDRDFDILVQPWAEGWRGLRDLEIDVPEIHLEEFQLDSLKGFHVWRGTGPDSLFFRRGEAPNVLFYRGSGDDFTFEFLGRGRVHGMELRELNADLAEYFSVERGILVLRVDEDSRLGLRAGDVILSIDGRAVEDTRDVYRILGSYETDEAVTFTVMRHGRETRVDGTVT